MIPCVSRMPAHILAHLDAHVYVCRDVCYMCRDLVYRILYIDIKKDLDEFVCLIEIMMSSSRDHQFLLNTNPSSKSKS